jgi:hypothetical protein
MDHHSDNSHRGRHAGEGIAGIGLSTDVCHVTWGAHIECL